MCSATSDVPNTLLVSMTIPNLQGVTASPTPGPYIVDRCVRVTVVAAACRDCPVCARGRTCDCCILACVPG